MAKLEMNKVLITCEDCGEGEVYRAHIEIDNRTFTQHHVDKEMPKEEFLMIALANALGYEPSEVLNFKSLDLE